MPTILGRVLLAAMLVTVMLSVLLPANAIAWMRENWIWFHWAMSWVERADSAVNLVHAILFLMLGVATRTALPRWRMQPVALAMLFVGAATELAQLLVPGRHARLSDLLVDIVAGVLGWTLARWWVGKAADGDKP